MLDLTKLNLDEIAEALADQTDYEHLRLINPRTGDIAFWTSDTGIDGHTPVELDDLDLLPIEPLPSHVWYRDMAEFAEVISDEPAGRRLARAIEGRGAFRRFKNELHDEYPQLLPAWYAFRDARAKRRAVEWSRTTHSSTVTAPTTTWPRTAIPTCPEPAQLAQPPSAIVSASSRDPTGASFRRLRAIDRDLRQGQRRHRGPIRTRAHAPREGSPTGGRSPWSARYSKPPSEVHMPASIKRIRESWNVKPTARNKGLTLTLKVTAYDNGMVEVDGIPINVEPHYDQGHGWLGAADVITTTLDEFRKDAAARRKQPRRRPESIRTRGGDTGGGGTTIR